MINKIIKFLFIFFLLTPFLSEAITLDKSVYNVGSEIKIKDVFDDFYRLTIYHFDLKKFTYCQTTFDEIRQYENNLNSVCAGDDYSMDIGKYSIMEHSEEWALCNLLDYNRCKEHPSFLNEFLFEVKKEEGSGGYYYSQLPSEPQFTSGGGGGPTAYRPEIKLISPEGFGYYGNQININYEATDKNDELDQKTLGLGDSPVTVYYSRSSDISQKIQLGTNLPPKGFFVWNTKDIPDGDFYRVIVEAKDNSGEVGVFMTEPFTIDHTIPLFTVTTDPAVSRGEDVKITVESTKELMEPPFVKVAQSDFNYFVVEMSGKGRKFEGVYRVIRGYDGMAVITVSGKDMAGNESDMIVGGGQFGVGVEPPPKPIILSPLDKDVVSTQKINVSGTARKETEIILSVNGKEKYSKFADNEGKFLFSDIKLSPDFNSGKNFLSVVSRDVAFNLSETADISIKYNIDPEVFITSPISGETVSTSTKIFIRAEDKNKDRLRFTYEASSDGGNTWIKISENTPSREIIWNTTSFVDGLYRLRVTVDDGFSKKSSTMDKITINNLLPTFSFDGGDTTITNNPNVVLKGKVNNSPKMTEPVFIKSLEYSLDNKKNWTSNDLSISGLNSGVMIFELPLSSLREGTHKVYFRATDSRNIKVEGLKTVIVDFGPPDSPKITSLKNGDILSDRDDENRNVAGVQFALRGESEPLSSIKVTIRDKVFEGKTNSSGKFSVSGVTVREKGENRINVKAEDVAGNESASVEVRFIYNNPPEIKFLEPRAGRGFSGKGLIKYSVLDPDSNKITSSVLSFKKPGENNFSVLDKDSLEGTFDFDVSDFKEGFGYELKIEATDGVSPASKTIQFFVDNTIPNVFINPIKDKVFKKDFRFEAVGLAEDALSGIEFVEYSLDGERWWKAIIEKGYLTKRAQFRVKHPFSLSDGEYEIKFRSVDMAGNNSSSWVEKITIDTMPPRMGAIELSHKGITLFPELDKFVLPIGVEVDLKISLEPDTNKAEILIGGDKKQLSKDFATGLWIATLSFDKEGEYKILLNAEDSFNNFVSGKEVTNILVKRLGVISSEGEQGLLENISGAEITALVFDKEKQKFIRWPGEIYGLENPIASHLNGSYLSFLPPGKYDIVIKKKGFVNIRTGAFELRTARFIDNDFVMNKRTGIRGYIEDVLEEFLK